MNVSPINKIEKEKFQEICKSKNTLADIIRSFDLSPEAGNYITLRRRIKKENIDISHIKLGISSNRNRKFGRKYTKEYILSGEKIESKSIKELKKYLIEYKILDKVCKLCGQEDKWNNLPLVLQLDHIDGNRENNLVDNLRLLCPNCHSQTNTFSGKKTGKNKFLKKQT